MHKLSGWFYHADGKSCALCLTCGDEAVGRRANDFTRIGTFEIISSHYYVLIERCLRQDRRQFNKLWVILKNVSKIQDTVYDEKKIDIFAAIIVYLNYIDDDSLKTV